MSHAGRIRYQRLLREAEGYLELGLPHLAIAALRTMDEPGTFRGQAALSAGRSVSSPRPLQEAIEVLRSLGRQGPEQDRHLPGSRLVLQANRPARIWRLSPCRRGSKSIRRRPFCTTTWRATGAWPANKDQALDVALAKPCGAIRIIRELISGESDFDDLRNDPEFQALLSVTV